MRTCSNCGRENPEEARFCADCGSRLGDAPASAREERKVVTILFADLVGFTSRSEQLDPEDVRATLTPYFTRLREELEGRGGTVEKFIGDASWRCSGAHRTRGRPRTRRSGRSRDPRRAGGDERRGSRCGPYVGDRVRRALDVHQRTLDAATRYGMEGAVIWNKAEVAFDLFLVGRWDESLTIMDAELARMEAGAPNYLEAQHRHVRALIRVGRGDWRRQSTPATTECKR